MPIPYPSFFLLFVLFAPVFVKNLVKNFARDLLRVYQCTRRITIPFGIIVIISLLWGLHPEAYWDENGRFIYFNLYHFVLLILSIGLAFSEIVQKYYRVIILTALIAASISIGVDVVNPGTYSYQTTRASGFIGNANEGALVVLYLAIGSINWKKNDLLNLFVLSITGLAIFATLSMGTLALFLIALATYILLMLKQNSTVMKNAGFIIIFFSLISYIVIPMAMDTVSNSDMFSHVDSQNRVDELFNMGHGDLTFVEDHDRIRLIKVYMEFIMEAPLLGHGTGFTPPDENESHNIYLWQWVQNGLPGLLAYLALMVYSFYHFMILKDIRGMVFICVIFGAGFFDHNLLNSKTFIGLLGILGTVAYLENSNAPKRLRPREKSTW